MKTIKATLLALGVAAIFTACGDNGNDNIYGNWNSSAPESVTQNIAGASSATKTMTFDFNAPVNGTTGNLTLTADYDVHATIGEAAVAKDTTYQVTATIKGTWAQDVDDQDDYLLTFDKNTLDVKGVNAPELGPVTDDFLNSLAQFTTIEDVEISKDGTHLTFETKQPEVKYHFVRK